jgi:hypothetical protein
MRDVLQQLTGTPGSLRRESRHLPTRERKMNAVVKIEKAKPTGLDLLRAPFDAHQISKLPKPYKRDSPKGNCRECGGYHGLPAAHLDYVGHAAITDRLLDCDPEWSWEPLSFGPDGLPVLDKDGGMWIRLTVCGQTRLGYGDAQGKTGPDATKERIGDAIRNAAMRFGAALALWHKGELHPVTSEGDTAAEDADKASAVASEWMDAIHCCSTIEALNDMGAEIAKAGLPGAIAGKVRAAYAARKHTLGGAK